jgi:hypothetical protein
MKDYILSALLVLGFAAGFVFAVLFNTSAEGWSAGKHDSKCNQTDNCGCYERLAAGKTGR